MMGTTLSSMSRATGDGEIGGDHPPARRGLAKAVAGILLVCIALSATVVSAGQPAGAAMNNFCQSTGYNCVPNVGYKGKGVKWGAYDLPGGHNCTSFVEYVWQRAGAGRPSVWRGSPADLKGRGNRTPAVGSVAVWTGHVAIVTKVMPSYIHVREDNAGYNVTRWRRINRSDKSAWNWSSDLEFFHHNDAKVRAYINKVGWGPDPFIKLETLSSPATGKLRVKGYALDADRPKDPVTVVVWVGGPSGTKGAKRYEVVAKVNRSDVNQNWGGFGAKHGYDITWTVPANLRGKNRPVYVYALNRGDGGGKTTSLGKKTLTIK